VGRTAEAEFKAAEFIQQHALSSPAHVMIFPETVVPRWTQATDLFWQPTLGRLARDGKAALIGTTFDIAGRPAYENGIVIRGNQTGSFLQQVPVPIGMWDPLKGAGAQLGLFGHP
jgi:apolipoprotein N-acyltransferase